MRHPRRILGRSEPTRRFPNSNNNLLAETITTSAQTMPHLLTSSGPTRGLLRQCNQSPRSWFRISPLPRNRPKRHQLQHQRQRERHRRRNRKPHRHPMFHPPLARQFGRTTNPLKHRHRPMDKRPSNPRNTSNQHSRLLTKTIQQSI